MTELNSFFHSPSRHEIITNLPLISGLFSSSAADSSVHTIRMSSARPNTHLLILSFLQKQQSHPGFVKTVRASFNVCQRRERRKRKYQQDGQQRSQGETQIQSRLKAQVKVLGRIGWRCRFECIGQKQASLISTLSEGQGARSLVPNQ